MRPDGVAKPGVPSERSMPLANFSYVSLNSSYS